MQKEKWRWVSVSD